MKKVWSVIVALIMALTIFVVPTFATEGSDADPAITPAAEQDVDLNAEDPAGDPAAVQENQDPQSDPQANDNEEPPQDPAENNEDVALTFPERPAAVTGLAGKAGYASIIYTWTANEGASGYAVSRYNGEIKSGQYMDVGEQTAYNFKDYQNKPMKQRTVYALRVISYVKLDRQPVGQEEIAQAEAAGAIKINPSKEYVMPSETAAILRVTTLTKERVVRTKYDKGYKYYYYDQNNIDRGTSYDMWNTIKNKKSKTKYLIALDTRRNNVIIYKGKKGNWKVHKRFVCSCGVDGHRTPRGDFKIQRKKPKFQTGDKVGAVVVRPKYTCWYATKFKGAVFFHSTLYMLNSKSRHAARHVGKHYSHGCVRLEIANAKWIYKNCGKGTAVISRKYGKDLSYKYLYKTEFDLKY